MVLAGGYAVAANGMGDRFSEDVDLFTNRDDVRAFAHAASALEEAYRRAGLVFEAVRRGPTGESGVLASAVGEFRQHLEMVGGQGHEPVYCERGESVGPRPEGGLPLT